MAIDTKTMETLTRGVAPRRPPFRTKPNSALFLIRRSRPNRALLGLSAPRARRSTVMGFYTPRRCLPLARRLFITSLPPRERMRTRKP